MDEASPARFEGMKGRLVRVKQGPCVFFPPEGHAALPPDGHADLARRLILLVENALIGAIRMEQMAVQAAKIALDPELLLQRLDTVQASGLAFVPKLRYVLPAP